MSDASRTQARLRLKAKLLEAVSQAVIATDLEGRVLYWNRAAEELYGWTAEEVEGRHILDTNPAEGHEDEAERIMAVLRRGRSWTGEFAVRRKDGTRFQAHVHNSPILDDEGRVTGIIGISSDITKEKALEDQLLQIRKLEAIGRLAGGVAHDFNNLLTVIQGHARLLLEDLPERSQLREDVEQILDAARRAAGLTRHLLAFSRRQLLDEKVVDLAQAVVEMEPMVRHLVPDNVELSFERALGTALVRADPGQLHQVIFNLALNARDAMEGAGRIAFRVTTVQLSDREAAELPWRAESGPYVELTVEDTGKGMSASVLARIFEPFFTTKPEGEAAGLGLSTVFGIVKQSGGHIFVASEPGVGTTFRVLLPLTDGVVPDEPVDEDVSQLDPGFVGRVVLVVDDDPSVREVSTRILERAGYEVLSAGNGRDALTLLRERGAGIHLVLSDIVMPEMGGLGLVDAMRELNSELPVVLMSGYSEEELAAGARQRATAFIEKPFSPERLTRVVRDTLRN